MPFELFGRNVIIGFSGQVRGIMLKMSYFSNTSICVALFYFYATVNI